MPACANTRPEEASIADIDTRGTTRMPETEPPARASATACRVLPIQGDAAALSQAHRLPLVSRIACGTVLGGVWAAGYFGIAWHVAPVADLTTALDTAIPFVGWTVWAYLAGLPWIVAPLAVVREPGLFRRAACAYAIAIGTGFLCFTTLQTEAPALRAQSVPDGLGCTTSWALRTLHRADAPVNLLPSLHVTLAWLAAWALAACVLCRGGRRHGIGLPGEAAYRAGYPGRAAAGVAVHPGNDTWPPACLRVAEGPGCRQAGHPLSASLNAAAPVPARPTRAPADTASDTRPSAPATGPSSARPRPRAPAGSARCCSA